jgi:hypothetical protein
VEVGEDVDVVAQGAAAVAVDVQMAGKVVVAVVAAVVVAVVEAAGQRCMALYSSICKINFIICFHERAIEMSDWWAAIGCGGGGISPNDDDDYHRSDGGCTVVVWW